MKIKNIYFWHGDRKISIAHKKQEILDITDGFGGDPIPFDDTVESFKRALRKAMINSYLEKTSESDVT